MSTTDYMIQSNKMNRAMQRTGHYFSSYKSAVSKVNSQDYNFSMEIDQEKLKSVKLKWKKQNRRDRIKILVFCMILIALITLFSAIYN